MEITIDLKQELKQRFNELFPNCTLWKIHMSRTNAYVWYKEDNGLRHIDQKDNCWVDVVENFKDADGNIESSNKAKTLSLFEGINVAEMEILFFKDMRYWTCPF